MSHVPSLRDYFVLEARRSTRRAPLVVAVLGVLAVLATHAIVPRLPWRAIELMQRGFRLQGMAAVLLFNDIVAIYFASFFVGVAGLLEAVVVTREEHRLELLLAKPVPASSFLLARMAPVLASSTIVGGVVTIATALLLAPRLDAASSISLGGAVGTGLFLAAVALTGLAALTIVFVRLRDALQGLLIASASWVLTLMPTAVLLYRPDLFQHRAQLAASVVLSSLLWHDQVMCWVGPLSLGAAVPTAALLLRLAAARLDHAGAL